MTLTNVQADHDAQKDKQEFLHTGAALTKQLQETLKAMMNESDGEKKEAMKNELTSIKAKLESLRVEREEKQPSKSQRSAQWAANQWNSWSPYPESSNFEEGWEAW